jgi:hypothetical protein
MAVELRAVDRGDVVLASVAFTNAAGAPTNPTAVTFMVRTLNTQTDYVYGTDDEVTRPSTGTYVLTLPIATDRKHDIRVVGTGAVIAAARGLVHVEDDAFTP